MALKNLEPKRNALGQIVYPYRVDFNWTNDSYNNFDIGIHSIVICVESESQFTALTEAWDKLSTLNLPEPTKFSASRKKENC